MSLKNLLLLLIFSFILIALLFFQLYGIAGLGSYDLGFTGNEALYALYSLKKNIAYTEHPALVGALVTLFSPDNGQINEFTFRLISVILNVINSLLLFILTRKFFKFDSWQLAWWVVVFYNLSLISQLNAIFNLGFTLLLTLYLLLTIFLFRALVFNKIIDWILAAISLVLLINTHYIMIFFFVCLLIYILLEFKFSQHKTGLGIFISFSLIGFIPIIIWNINHDWSSFLYFKKSLADSLKISDFYDFISYQFLLNNILFIAPFFAIYIGIKRFKELNVRFIFILSIVFYLLTILTNSSGFVNNLLNVGNVLFLILMIRILLWQQKHLWAKLLKWVSLGIGISLGTIFFLTIITKIVPFPDYKNPLYFSLGWKKTASIVKKYIKNNPDSSYIFIENKNEGYKLYWYTYPLKVTLITDEINDINRWNPTLAAKNKKGYLISIDRANIKEVFYSENYFSSCEIKQTFIQKNTFSIIAKFYIQYCKNFLYL